MKNKYGIVSAFLTCLSVLMIVFMIIRSAADYRSYLQHPEYSAPFSVYLIHNSVIYGVPAILGLTFSIIFKRKVNK